MTNFSVTTYNTTIGTMDSVLGLLKAKLDTIDNTKVIRLVETKNMGCDYTGIIIYDT